MIVCPGTRAHKHLAGPQLSSTGLGCWLAHGGPSLTLLPFEPLLLLLTQHWTWNFPQLLVMWTGWWKASHLQHWTEALLWEPGVHAVGRWIFVGWPAVLLAVYYLLQGKTHFRSPVVNLHVFGIQAINYLLKPPRYQALREVPCKSWADSTGGRWLNFCKANWKTSCFPVPWTGFELLGVTGLGRNAWWLLGLGWWWRVVEQTGVELWPLARSRVHSGVGVCERAAQGGGRIGHGGGGVSKSIQHRYFSSLQC